MAKMLLPGHALALLTVQVMVAVSVIGSVLFGTIRCNRYASIIPASSPQ
jgi:hypothetical protein